MKKMNDISRFIRPELGAFQGYSACKSPDEFQGRRVIKLDANENNYGPSPKAIEALAAFPGYYIYPDALQCDLKEALAHYTGVDASHIVCGAGSDQLIDLLIRLFAAPDEEIINLPPTFAMFNFYADLGKVQVKAVPRDEGFHIDVAGIKQAVTARTKLIFIANPNNPTGTMTEKKDILEVLSLGLPTVVDEAYYEFTGETFGGEVGRIPNLIVLRTFSKWAGLAGLRVGYGLFPEAIANRLHAIRDPYNVNMAAMVAARASLQDVPYLLNNVKKIVAERERLAAKLTRFAWLKAYPSRANFILCQMKAGVAKELQGQLEARGILVRHFDSPALPNCVRFSVGKPEEDDILLEALGELAPK
jgi:histidinol-phosphate aminotransferase